MSLQDPIYLLFEPVCTELRARACRAHSLLLTIAAVFSELFGAVFFTRWSERAGSSLVSDAEVSSAPGGAGSIRGSSCGDTFAGGVRGRGSVGTCLLHLQREGRRYPKHEI